MAELKTKVTKASVAKFIAAVPDARRREDAKTMLKLMESVTKEKGKMWGPSMIGYGKYHYKSERSSQEGDWPLAAFSPRKAALVVYVMAGANMALMKKMGPHKFSGGSCVYIKDLKQIDLKILKKIIADSVAYMKKKYPAA